MERIVNYSSEDDNEDSPKRNAAERCPALEINPNKRNKGDPSSRHPKEENTRDKNQGLSFHRDNKDVSHNTSRKSSQREENNRNSRPSSSRDQHHHRSDDNRRSERSHDKKRDSKDDRRRKESHRDRDRERDRDYEHRDLNRDRRDRSDKYRRDKYSKDNTHRGDKSKRRRSSESPKDHNSSSNRGPPRNRSTSRSPSRDKRTAVSPPPSNKKPHKYESKEEAATSGAAASSQNKSATNFQAVISPPLSDEAPKTSAIVINKTDGTPIALPTYYNPNIINPTKYAEQVQKRKLIWGAKKTEDTSAKWGHATFSEDSDGKVASKFMRLMGIKSAPKPSDAGGPEDQAATEKKGPDVKSRQAMFSNMEQQYEVARQVTHTMRGVGLGFGSQSRQY